MDETRAHVASLDCWCQPITIGYGNLLRFNDDGLLVALEADADEDDE